MVVGEITLNKAHRVALSHAATTTTRLYELYQLLLIFNGVLLKMHRHFLLWLEVICLQLQP